MKRIVFALLLVALLVCGDFAGWSDHSIVGSYHLDLSSIA